MPALVGWTTRTLRAGDRLLFGTVRLIRLYEIFPREQTLITAIRSRSRAMTFESVNGADPVLFSAPGWIHPAERRVLPAMESFTGRSDLFTDRPDPQPRDPLPIQVFPTETDEFVLPNNPSTIFINESVSKLNWTFNAFSYFCKPMEKANK